MTVLSDEMTFGLRQLINEQGGLVTFRHVTTLAGANPAPNPPTYIAAVVNGATLAGASAINVRVDLTQGGVFTGRVVANDTFTIAGDSTVYTISGQVISPSGNDTLTAVPFTPNLARNAADGAAITFAWSADITNILASITTYPVHLINGTTIETGDRQVRMMASSISGITPKNGDMVITPDGIIYKVVRPKQLEIDGVVYGWSLQVRR